MKGRGRRCCSSSLLSHPARGPWRRQSERRRRQNSFPSFRLNANYSTTTATRSIVDVGKEQIVPRSGMLSCLLSRESEGWWELQRCCWRCHPEQFICDCLRCSLRQSTNIHSIFRNFPLCFVLLLSSNISSSRQKQYELCKYSFWKIERQQWVKRGNSLSKLFPVYQWKIMSKRWKFRARGEYWMSNQTIYWFNDCSTPSTWEDCYFVVEELNAKQQRIDKFSSESKL